MKINELVEKAHAMAVEKHWWHGVDRSPLELHMLVVSEIAEATEEARNGNPPVYYIGENGNKESTSQNFLAWEFPKDKKPEGELIELADAVIRIADICGRKGWDLERAIELKMAYNATRPQRHGGKLA